MRKRIDHWCSVSTGKSQPSGPPFQWETRQALFPTGTVDPRVGIFLSPPNTNDGFLLSHPGVVQVKCMPQLHPFLEISTFQLEHIDVSYKSASFSLNCLKTSGRLKSSNQRNLHTDHRHLVSFHSIVSYGTENSWTANMHLGPIGHFHNTTGTKSAHVSVPGISRSVFNLFNQYLAGS